jgi:rod shape-determining protein MreC
MIGFLVRRKNWVALSVALVLQIILLGTQATGRNNVRFVRLWANVLIIPAQQLTSGFSSSISSLWQRYVGLHHVSEENRQLKEQIQALTLEKNRMEAEVQAGRRLQQLLDLKEAAPWASVAAQVIGLSPSESYRTVIIGKGANAGLVNNLPVMTPEGIVGRIVQVSSRSAVVQLITDSESGVGVVFEKSRVHGVAKGMGTTELTVDYVVNEESISIDEVIRTSGDDQIYPRDLLVGRVVSVQSGSGIFKKIMASPAARLSRLEEVLVMKKSSARE